MSENKLVDNPQVIPESMNPQTAAEFVQRGWLFYSQKQYEHAIHDYREALSREPDVLDTHFALAIALKYAGSSSEAAIEFSRVVDLAGTLDDKTRATMLTRLARGHINDIKTGKWGAITE